MGCHIYEDEDEDDDDEDDEDEDDAPIPWQRKDNQVLVNSGKTASFGRTAA